MKQAGLLASSPWIVEYVTIWMFQLKLRNSRKNPTKTSYFAGGLVVISVLGGKKGDREER